MNINEQLEYINEHFPFESSVNSKKRIRQTIFSSIDTEFQAYLLGLYASDGSIDEKRKTFRMHLQKRDSYIINLIKEIVGPDSRTFELKNKTCFNKRNGKAYNVQDTFGIDINSTKICNDLVNLGIGYRKTYKELHIPKIKQDLVRHFIRGYFDGDGTITGSYVKPDFKWKKHENFRTTASICSKTKTMLVEIQDVLMKNGIKGTIAISRRDEMFILSIPKMKLPKLFDFLYKDSNFYFTRKYDKFYHYVNTEVSQLIAEYRNAQKVNDSNSNNPSKSTERP